MNTHILLQNAPDSIGSMKTMHTLTHWSIETVLQKILFYEGKGSGGDELKKDILTFWNSKACLTEKHILYNLA